jgi:hypothetical protein
MMGRPAAESSARGMQPRGDIDRARGVDARRCAWMYVDAASSRDGRDKVRLRK